jgi:NADPH:quinone reductase-like Zn-dependent oxidoreductase
VRAIVYTKYGPPEVLQIKEVEKPTAKDNEVLIRVYSTTVTAADSLMRRGASGSIGTYAVQLAKYFGAEVTGVCSTVNIELVKSLGADKVIDYTKEDFLQNSETYDIIFDTVGKSSFSRCKSSLKKNGLYLLTTGSLINYVLMLWTSMIGGKKLLCGMSIEKTEALIFISEPIEAGKMKPVIDRCYPLEQIADAHGYVDRGHKKGSVVITVEHNSKPSNPLHCH